MQVSERLVQEIIPYENNPRNNDEAVDKVAESIREFGFQQPIVIDKDGVVIVGHTRLKAAKKLGLKTVPVVTADNLTDEQAKAYRLADNKTNEFAEWDIDALDIELLDISDIDMGRFGFEVPEEADDGEIIEDDFSEDVEPRAKTGDVWQLGEHRLICGDSTEQETIEKLMDGNEADLLITDPPYNVDYTGKTKDALKIKGDNMNDAAFREFLTKAFETANSVIKPGGRFTFGTRTAKVSTLEPPPRTQDGM